MSIYDTVLTAAEQRALRKHTGSLRDETNLLRILIRRQLADDGEQDIELVVKTAAAIGKLEATRVRAEAQRDDPLRLAMLEALNLLDKEAEDESS